MAVIDNLVAYWSFDEASGSAIDAHAANDLAEASGTIDSATGKVGNARDFEAGDTEYLTIASNADLQLGADTAFTWAFWQKAETSPQCGGSAIIEKDGYSGTNQEYVFIHSAGCVFSFVVGNGSSAATVNATGAQIYTAATDWHFVVGWHDPTANKIFISIDDNTPTETAWSGGTVNAGTSPLYVGVSTPIGSPAYYDGLIDETGFWKKALDSGERTWLYNGGAGRSYADIVAEGGGSGNRRRRLLLCGA